MRLHFILLTVIFASSLGCQDLASKPDSRMVARHIAEISAAETVDAYIKMNSGHMKLGANAVPLMLASFHYNSPIWSPNLIYKEIEKKGWLTLSQEMVPTIGSFARNDAMNQWDVQFNKSVPLELTIEYGKGQALLDLNDLNLKRLKIINEQGLLNVDLSKAVLEDDIIVWINNDYGDMKINLPDKVGVRVTTVRGGEIKAEKLTKEEKLYTNELVGTDSKQIFIDIRSSAGSIEIQ